MTMVTDKDYGGLEHINSTALISPRGDMPALTNPKSQMSIINAFLGYVAMNIFTHGG